MVRLIVMTDEPILLCGLQALIDLADGVSFLGGLALDGPLSDLVTNKPDVLLIDAPLDKTLSVAGWVRSAVPACRVVWLTRSLPREATATVLDAGIRGILRKTLPAERILRYVENIWDGQLCYDVPFECDAPNAGRVALTGRERELMTLVSQGLRNKEIASTLGICEGSVKVYLTKLYRKVGARDRCELLIYGLGRSGPWPHVLPSGGPEGDRTGVELDQLSLRPPRSVEE